MEYKVGDRVKHENGEIYTIKTVLYYMDTDSIFGYTVNECKDVVFGDQIKPMSLSVYLDDLKIGQIEDDSEFMEAEYNAIHTYCESYKYSLIPADIAEIKSRGLYDNYMEWLEDYLARKEEIEAGNLKVGTDVCFF